MGVRVTFKLNGPIDGRFEPSYILEVMRGDRALDNIDR